MGVCELSQAVQRGWQRNELLIEASRSWFRIARLERKAMLTGDQINDVWEGQISAEVRALYSGDLASIDTAPGSSGSPVFPSSSPQAWPRP